MIGNEIIILKSGNNVEHSGVWTYQNGMELPFINHKWTCGGDNGVVQYHGDERNHLLLGIHDANWEQSGSWCNAKGSTEYCFICEKGTGK